MTEETVGATTGRGPNWWTPRRVTLAGIGAIGGGLIGLTFLGLAELPVGRIGRGADFGLVGLLFPISYFLFSAALLAGNASFGARLGTSGRRLGLLLALSNGIYAGSILLLIIGNSVTASAPLAIGVVTGTAYLAIRLLGTLYGLGLWQAPPASRVTAALFIVLLPIVFIVGPFTNAGLSAGWIEAALDLAYVALGIDLVRTARRDQTRRGELQR